jgi:hypothetical protein
MFSRVFTAQLYSGIAPISVRLEGYFCKGLLHGPAIVIDRNGLARTHGEWEDGVWVAIIVQPKDHPANGSGSCTDESWSCSDQSSSAQVVVLEHDNMRIDNPNQNNHQPLVLVADFKTRCHTRNQMNHRWQWRCQSAIGIKRRHRRRIV